jgi:hypothetical protein
MSDKKILFKKLDDILMGMFSYSFILGDWGKYVWIIIYLRDNGYSGKSYVVNPKKIPDFERKKICNSCLEDIYVSEYDYTNNIYNFYYNDDIEEVRKNFKKIEEIARNIEKTAIKVYKMLLKLNILDPSENYSKLLIYFRRDISDYNKILEEIKNSSIFGKSVSEKVKSKVKSKDQPVYIYRAIGRDLSNPKGYTFSFMVYKQINY